jgi:hypothetical protein
MKEKKVDNCVERDVTTASFTPLIITSHDKFPCIMCGAVLLCRPTAPVESIINCYESVFVILS